MCDQQSLRSACAYAQSDQCLCQSLEYSMMVKLLTEHHLEFLSLTGGCGGSSESTLVKMSNCWKSQSTAQLYYKKEAYIRLSCWCGSWYFVVYCLGFPINITLRRGYMFMSSRSCLWFMVCCCVYIAWLPAWSFFFFLLFRFLRQKWHKSIVFEMKNRLPIPLMWYLFILIIFRILA